MNKIVKATVSDAKILSKVSVESFLVPHGHSSPKHDIEAYISKNFNEDNLRIELSEPTNEYYLIYHNNQLAGFSKVIFNISNENIEVQNITKMERLYLLKEFYGLNLGKVLFDFNAALSQKNNQAGIWLAVWTENPRAIAFYTKMGMKNVGSYDFPVSKTHSNPNHIMYLKY